MGIASDLAMALDATALARAGGIVPDAWQAAVLRSAAPRLLLNCCRQSGKSTISAALALHTALYTPGALVLLLSPSLRQSSELFRKVADLWGALGRPVPAEAETALRLELENGGRIVSLPGTERTVRGYSGVRLLIVDEASRVDDGLYYSIRPMLGVSGGRLVALSTPFGKRGWWHDAWVNGGEAWQRVQVTAHDCPRISPAFLAEERRSMPALWFQSEYECRFVEVDDAVFGWDLVQSALSDEVKPLFGGG